MKLVITHRDIEFFIWLNGWGFVTVSLTSLWMGVDFSTAARRLRRLVGGGYLKRIIVEGVREPGIVLTEVGRRLAGDPLHPLSGIRHATWRHDTLMCSLEPRILRQFSAGARLNPERRIQSNYDIADLPVPHLPDAEVRRVDGSAFAFELELSLKTPHRLRQIIDGYATAHYRKIYYLTDRDDVARHVKRFTVGLEDLFSIQKINLTSV